MPAFRSTTPLLHLAIALLIAAAVVPGLRVAQIVVRLGIPPVTPARLQSMVRPAAASESTIVWADANAGRTSTPTTSRTCLVHFIRYSPQFPRVTPTGGDVATLPVASRATAVIVCSPFRVDSVYQEIRYGGAVTSRPRFCPLTLNWTPATRSLSLTAAVRSKGEPATLAPLTGAVSLTVGCVPYPPLASLTITGADVFTLPVASRATAVSVCWPSGVASVDQETRYGGVVTSLPRFCPLTLNWTPTTRTLSLASA